MLITNISRFSLIVIHVRRWSHYKPLLSRHLGTAHRHTSIVIVWSLTKYSLKKHSVRGKKEKFTFKFLLIIFIWNRVSWSQAGLASPLLPRMTWSFWSSCLHHWRLGLQAWSGTRTLGPWHFNLKGGFLIYLAVLRIGHAGNWTRGFIPTSALLPTIF